MCLVRRGAGVTSMCLSHLVLDGSVTRHQWLYLCYFHLGPVMVECES